MADKYSQPIIFDRPVYLVKYRCVRCGALYDAYRGSFDRLGTSDTHYCDPAHQGRTIPMSYAMVIEPEDDLWRYAYQEGTRSAKEYRERKG
jgi:hypothetical protein